jgi:hypothetical protein
MKSISIFITLIIFSMSLTICDLSAQSSGSLQGTINDASSGQGIEFVQVKIVELSMEINF